MENSGTAELISTEAQAALDVPETPAYVYSESVLRKAATDALAVASYAGCKLLYTLKPCGLVGVLETLAPHVHGFAASSVFESRLAREVTVDGQTLHCYSPAFSAVDMDELLSMVDYLSVNSVNQLELAASLIRARAKRATSLGSVSIGLRVNPEMGFAADARYDPCRPHSKLGVPISDFRRLLGTSPISDKGRSRIEGIHVHNNCESEDLTQLAATVESIEDILRTLDRPAWVNLGGGYYLGPEIDADPLAQAVRKLREEFGVTVFIEPGTALVQQAGMLVSEALDVFESGGKRVAVLDASTSHMPEVFEYGFAPSVSGSFEGGESAMILAGRSCLAGDVFGEYEFRDPLRIGDRVAIMDAGSYSHSRAAPFNGIPIPSSYLLREDGGFDRMTAYGYRDFAQRNQLKAGHVKHGMVAVATA